jgi:DNA-binding beta-propeller fold protein YncE
MVGASPIASAQTASPKAYIHLFGDNAIAVLDTAANLSAKTIPIPTDPHGLVITPDNNWVYASSDSDSVVTVISTAIPALAQSRLGICRTGSQQVRITTSPM